MEFFESVDRIRYEGSESHNPLAFHRYDADRMVAGRTMRDRSPEEPIGGSGRQEQLEKADARHVDRAH